MPLDRDYQRFTKKQKIIFVTVLLCVILSGGALMLWYNYQITDVTVSGNEHYTEEEITEMVMKGKLSENSLYLKLKYRNREIKDIPFIETMDVEITSPHSITINVYEKALAGYVEYLDRYMYFDKDGIVVESSTLPTEGIPMVTGLKFDHVLLHEKLPVSDPDIFKMILGITQLLTKYDISTDKIYFSKDLEVTLYFGDIRAFLGDYDSIDEKVNELKYLLPLHELQGLKGVLHMENYTPESGKITFEKDEEPGKSEDLSLPGEGEETSSDKEPQSREPKKEEQAQEQDQGQESEGPEQLLEGEKPEPALEPESEPGAEGGDAAGEPTSPESPAQPEDGQEAGNGA